MLPGTPISGWQARKMGKGDKVQSSGDVRLKKDKDKKKERKRKYGMEENNLSSCSSADTVLPL